MHNRLASGIYRDEREPIVFGESSEIEDDWPRPLEPSVPPIKTTPSSRLAHLLATATDLFGSTEEAERWMMKPALGLDGRRPIDLITTDAGVEIVDEFLTRLNYGVYQ